MNRKCHTMVSPYTFLRVLNRLLVNAKAPPVLSCMLSLNSIEAARKLSFRSVRELKTEVLEDMEWVITPLSSASLSPLLSPISPLSALSFCLSLSVRACVLPHPSVHPSPAPLPSPHPSPFPSPPPPPPPSRSSSRSRSRCRCHSFSPLMFVFCLTYPTCALPGPKLLTACSDITRVNDDFLPFYWSSPNYPLNNNPKDTCTIGVNPDSNTTYRVSILDMQLEPRSVGVPGCYDTLRLEDERRPTCITYVYCGNITDVKTREALMRHIQHLKMTLVTDWETQMRGMVIKVEGSLLLKRQNVLMLYLLIYIVFFLYHNK